MSERNRTVTSEQPDRYSRDTLRAEQTFASLHLAEHGD
jgi:hypothetical protein